MRKKKKKKKKKKKCFKYRNRWGQDTCSVFCIRSHNSYLKVGPKDRLQEIGNVYKISVGNPERKKQVRSPRRKWEDDIRTDLKETGWEDAD
jgi:hypothetical protein